VSPRIDFDSHITFRAEIEPDTCCGCGADCDPDGLCDGCVERRAEYGDHHPDCRCGSDVLGYGCCWWLATNARMAVRGLR